LISAVTVALSNVGRGGVELDAGTRSQSWTKRSWYRMRTAGAHDGFRILAFKDRDTVRLWSRNGRDLVLSSSRSGRNREAVLDGLPHLLARRRAATACFYALHLRWFEAQDLRG
jgi:hypothetical protein